MTVPHPFVPPPEFAAFAQCVRDARTCRRFREDVAVPLSALHALVDTARVCPSGANRQPLRYAVCDDAASNAAVFPHLRWAAYLKDWGGPVPGERPAAYIAVLCDRKGAPTPEIDLGIAAQTIQLGAQALGLGCCMIGAFDREGVRAALGLDAPPHAELDLVLMLALGVPAETRVLDTVGADGDIRYHRDADGTHRVPKRPLESVLLPVHGGNARDKG
ncbi:nitroreductase family protein [Nitratidesulfovibrio liaohensis]|uniref:Nitroreductase family protein n=1 Tax=Nitratidesulfovibrio liaohensis TaxID=2604158 RepID=A0ABY9R337_9BACT|nr:nitroreductase family protein [Nitratidesulfovibrio liaohensis]WMW66017.1 nitroreductase family protein [Nitratidesulfovibrio liaohensis]